MCCAKGLLPMLTDWHMDMAYCNTLSDAYHDLMLVRYHPKDIWGPYPFYLARMGNVETDSIGEGDAAIGGVGSKPVAWAPELLVGCTDLWCSLVQGTDV
ncbi:hypothetical protein NDU88_007863 [Pleurodeles waltl]|uniref:Uncharacterized protein n=1 Tax=Pleurodeles waltl TaxID=8319 RepID=A0AAV7NUA1_PLEWA|nr:hypothetical protein NDU88_007863 [Pleurodeles waltl]